MNKVILKCYFLLAIWVLVACQEKEELGSVSKGSVTLKASIENSESRTSVDEDGGVSWVTTDAIGVFGNETRNAKFQSISSGADVLFVGEMASRQDVPTLAYYPYDESAELDGNSLHFTLPSEFLYTGGSNAPMLGVKQADGSFVFKHLCGLMQITIQNMPENVKCLTIVSEGTEGQEAPYITGGATVSDVTAGGATFDITKDGGHKLSISLENVPAQEAYTFNIPIPLGDYPKLSVHLEMNDGTIKMDKSISNVSMARAKMLDMPVVKMGYYKDGVVSLAEAGTMKELLGNDYLNITSLKVVGSIDGDDVYVLRQMLGGHEFSKSVWGKLSVLDLSESTIVAGGRNYYEDRYGSYYTSNKVVGEMMFYQCAVLQNMVLPVNAVSIADGVFYGCTEMTSVVIGDAVKFIGTSAFSDCWALASINLPDGLTSISNGTFSMCQSLTSITIPKGVTTIGQNAFAVCLKLSTVTIPEGVTFIGNSAFRQCYALTSIKLPSTLKKIDVNAFEYCTSLTSITIPYGITEIYQYAFYGCEALTTVTIPKSVYNIGKRAFGLCPSLKEVYCHAIDPPYIMDEYGNNKAFDIYESNTTLYVPAESTCYYTSDWAVFFPEIVLSL